jgi:CheY-like chemotaxis protein
VLVVDDDEAVRFVVVMMLEDLGLEVASVTNGQEAIEALRRHPCALVVMDINMRVCDGLTATHAIRTVFSADQQPAIIGLTGWATEAVRATAIAAGMNDCLFKPVSGEEVRSVVWRWLGRR